MNAEIKAKWVAALRSGQYEQGRERLCGSGAFCCLGVLSDLYIRETGMGHWDGIHCATFKDKDGFREATELPSAVMIWADIETAAPYAYTPNGTVDLIEANDAGVPFPKIADIIEAYL